MRTVASSFRRGAATLVVAAVLLFPVAAFGDEAKILIPPGAPTPSMSTTGEIHIPPGFWDAVLLVWLEAVA
jgi:hypothetical protein